MHFELNLAAVKQCQQLALKSKKFKKSEGLWSTRTRKSQASISSMALLTANPAVAERTKWRWSHNDLFFLPYQQATVDTCQYEVTRDTHLSRAKPIKLAKTGTETHTKVFSTTFRDSIHVLSVCETVCTNQTKQWRPDLLRVVTPSFMAFQGQLLDTNKETLCLRDRILVLMW